MYTSKLEQLLQQTKEVADQIASIDSDALEQLVELRNEVLEELQAQQEIDGAARGIIGELSAYDDIILGRMHLLRDEASNGLMKFQHSRVQRKSYDNDFLTDSFFYDKKR